MNGSRIVITAAASGAGRATAEAFADAGARVVACDLDGAAVETMSRERPDILILRHDVGDEGEIDALFHEALGHLGGLDVLVNNAGIAGPTAAAEEVSLADWSRTLQVNLTGHFLCARRAIPFMKAQKSGAIINISSMTARLGLPLRLPYAVSKAGVLSLTQNLARELGPFNVRVNAILPGVIAGARIQRVIEAKAAALGVGEAEYEAELVRYASMRTMVSGQDIAAMCVFLASDAARHVSGQMIAVDGDLRFEP